MPLMPAYDCVVMSYITQGVKVRPAPSTANTSTTTMAANTHFQVSEIVPDALNPGDAAKKWGHIIGGPHDGKYCAIEYPGNPNPICSATPIPVDPGEPPAAQIPEALEVYPIVNGQRGAMILYILKVDPPNDL